MNHNKKQIYVDFDDVICETARQILELFSQMYNKGLKFEDITSYDLSEVFNINKEETAQLLKKAHEYDEMIRIMPIDGAVESLNRITSMGYEITVVTGRPPWTADCSKDWLHNHGVLYKDLKFRDKYSRYTEDEKEYSLITDKELIEYNFTYAIEDSPDVALSLSQEMNIPVLLMDRPWNRKINDQSHEKNNKIFRCHGWHEILDFI